MAEKDVGGKERGPREGEWVEAGMRAAGQGPSLWEAWGGPGPGRVAVPIPLHPSLHRGSEVSPAGKE